ncbi:MAG: 16S rRNA (uracil(1498)-N(3))-methyltransferase [Paludibacter sp. 47-17]|jgi:16S rRNA (uracil1498-N3)-methyltransferase|nr:MAG: 16S rRNA (uracil(1498)-N(3))-methyltransferase [Paludibacter sp. 47-17]
MHYFYVPIPAALVLPEEESLHAAKVLRLQTGDEITLLDGKGGVYRAEITLPHAKRCGYKILAGQQVSTGRSYRLHVAIAPTKNMERLEWFVEKAVEIGVDEITPVICRYSERKQVKYDRLEKIVLSACKQSVQAVFPLLHPQTSFDELVKNSKAECKTIAHCYPLDKVDFRKPGAAASDILILIGPEGDFSLEEVEMAEAHGFVAVSLGDSRLRTETAGIMACAAMVHTH